MWQTYCNFSQKELQPGLHSPGPSITGHRVGVVSCRRLLTRHEGVIIWIKHRLLLLMMMMMMIDDDDDDDDDDW